MQQQLPEWLVVREIATVMDGLSVAIMAVVALFLEDCPCKTVSEERWLWLDFVGGISKFNFFSKKLIKQQDQQSCSLGLQYIAIIQLRCDKINNVLKTYPFCCIMMMSLHHYFQLSHGEANPLQCHCPQRLLLHAPCCCDFHVHWSQKSIICHS